MNACFQNRPSVPSGSCLDTQRAPGLYWGTGWTDYPDGESGLAHVLCLGSGCVLYTPYVSSDLYFNHYVNGGWKGWKKLS